MKRGAKPHAIPPRDWKLSLPLDITAQVDLLLEDPVRKRPAYGARSALVEQLLREWVSRQMVEQRLTNSADNVIVEPR